MSRYIDADKAKEKKVYSKDRHEYVVPVAELDWLPTSDVQEVRHGHWEFRFEGTYSRTRCYCTVCKQPSGIGGIRKNQLKPYCPNCGAKMDEKEEKQ